MKKFSAFAALLLLFSAASLASGQSPVAPENIILEKKDLDITVYDQEGKRLKFYSDLIEGKTVAINFIFTSCTTICPPLGATFGQVQKKLAENGASNVSLISISVDPVTDTPERLKEWGARFKAGPGWTFVTGSKTGIDQLLAGLGQHLAQREDHSPTVIIGNERAHYWTTAYGLSAPTKLVQLIEAARTR